MKRALDLSGKSPATPWGHNLSYHPHIHDIVPAGLFEKDWNVDSRPVGNGVCTLR